MDGKGEDMAAAGEEEVEYESDPEEAKKSLTMRRREASDDEEEEDGEERDGREKPPRRIDSRGGIEPDGESDGEGAAAEYDDEESEMDEDEEEEEVEVEEEVVEEDYDEIAGKHGRENRSEVEALEAAREARVADTELDGGSVSSAAQPPEVEGVNQSEEEKKENEPFAVPTAGAFYMHDDRFRDNVGGRQRRTLGARRLWESKDDRKWGHDKFEEMTLHDWHYDDVKERRNPRGRYGVRGKNRGADCGYPRGNKSKAYSNSNQNHGPKSVRGRGPRRYESSMKNDNDAPPTRKMHASGKSTVKVSHIASDMPSLSTPNAVSNPIHPRKQTFASSLNSASPPFYPSGSSNKQIPLAQKRDLQAGAANRNRRPAIADESYSVTQSAAALRGKNVSNSIGMEKLYIHDSVSSVVGKPSTSLPSASSGSTLVSNSLNPRAQGRGVTPQGQTNFPPGMPHNQMNRSSSSSQAQTVQRSAVQGRVQTPLSPSAHELGQLPVGGSQTSSPPKASLSISSFESGEPEPSSEPGKSKVPLVGKERGGLQASGKGSFLYGGAQVIGAPGNMAGNGDQNFAATPAFLPVMPFGSQHPSGIGVPAVGMAFPGYVAQPQLGMGNSEMTWLPVLAGAAGALGATYCSPYIAVDGSYHARQSGQTSSAASSKENNVNKPSDEWKPSQRQEIVNDEFGQRQKNSRRYTEMSMSFGQ